MDGDEVTVTGPALLAMGVRLRAAGMALGDARDTHEAACRPAVDPVTSAHAAAAARWTEGLRVAAVALVEVGNELDRYVAATAATDDLVGVQFRGMPDGGTS